MRKNSQVFYFLEVKKSRDSDMGHCAERTREVSEKLRLLAYDFLRLRSIGETGEKILKEQGYSSSAKKAFIQKHRLGHDYFVQLRNRKEFKNEFFGHVTLRKAEYLELLIEALIKKDPLRAIQLIFPDQVGRALVNRSLNVNQTDDANFRDAFFGLGNISKNDDLEKI